MHLTQTTRRRLVSMVVLAGGLFVAAGLASPARADYTDVSLSVDNVSLVDPNVFHGKFGSSASFKWYDQKSSSWMDFAGAWTGYYTTVKAENSNGSKPAGTVFQAFCVEVVSNLAEYPEVMNGWVETKDITKVPQPGGNAGIPVGGMGSQAATLVQNLFDSWFGAGKSWSDFSAQQSAAFQLALWEIISDGNEGASGLNMDDGDFVVTSQKGTLTNLVQGFLDAASVTHGDKADLTAYSNYVPGRDGPGQDFQDLITVDGGITSVPVPPALALALAGIASLGGYGLRRRQPLNVA